MGEWEKRDGRTETWTLLFTSNLGKERCANASGHEKAHHVRQDLSFSQMQTRLFAAPSSAHRGRARFGPIDFHFFFHGRCGGRSGTSFALEREG